MAYVWYVYLHFPCLQGLFSENKEKLINNAILALLSQDAELGGPNAELEAQFQAIRRLIASKAGFQAFTQLPKYSRLLLLQLLLLLLQ